MGRLATMPQALALHNAFTLMELALIIAIIGILAAFALTHSISSFSDNAREATLDKYYKQLQIGYTQYTVVMGKRPRRFEDFVAPNQSLLDPDNGVVVSSITDKNGRANCIFNIPGRGDNTLTCAGGTWIMDRRRQISAVYSFNDSGVLVMTNVDRMFPP